MQATGRYHKRTCCPSFKLREVVSMYCTMVAMFFIILLMALKGTVPRENHFPYKIPLDPESILELSWNISYTEEVIYFQLLVKELKYGVILGMSDRGEFYNADLAVLWNDGDNSYFGDAWSDAKGKIHLDSHQDYQLLQAQNTSAGLSLLLKRPFSTCDPRDYRIEDGTIHLVYGFLDEPCLSLEAINTSAIQKGFQRVQLLKPNISIPEMPSDLIKMEIRAPNVTIPNEETTYWCYMKKLPDDFSQHHIIKYEPIITKGNEALVHHMEVFQCAVEFEPYPEFSGPCDAKMKSDRLNYCRHVLAAWALGAKAFYYPKEAGLPFGGPGSSKYLRLEVHYHNPLKIKDRIDNSGLRLHYTDKLRPFDAGIMELGLVYTPVMAIPPKETDFILTGYCTDKCTQLALPHSGIHIFASQLHTHLTGRKVITVIVREGNVTEIVNRDDHYSPHFQEIRMLKKIVTVLPGDVLVTSCTYNTESRELATVGGLSITKEMCVNYIHYYPLTQLELCKSYMDPGYLQIYFRFVNRFNNEEIYTCHNTSVEEQFALVPWNSLSRTMLKALYNFAPISMHCNKSSAVRFPGEWERQLLPTIKTRLEEVTPQCQDTPRLSPSASTLVNIDGKIG
ncbi:dopamine beta-hydroxylase [Monodelphis domestica]|uniref:dopamine beta-hydroxylase n=1 Tax=Monodelphis domestica TaxID=13616 RepID=UPI00005EB762|nr:dopamine beta-hydroxylase [Monodelphis domestica]